MNKTRSLVFIALLIAIEVILTRFFAIETPIIRIGFGFIAISLSAMLFGPLVGGMAAAIGDVLGMMIFPKGPFSPGFTLSALLTGMLFGVFLYNKPKSWLNIILASLTITLFIHLGLNTLWIAMMTGKAYIFLLLTRFLKEIIILPIQIVLIYFTWEYVGKNIQKKQSIL